MTARERALEYAKELGPEPSVFRWLADDQIERITTGELRHKTNIKPYDYLMQWLKITRLFGYATKDDSWGEMEKTFGIAMRRLVLAERHLRALEKESKDGW